MRLDGAALRVSLHTLKFVRKLQRRAALSSARVAAPEASAAEQPDDGASGEASRHASNDDAVPTADLHPDAAHADGPDEAAGLEGGVGSGGDGGEAGEAVLGEHKVASWRRAVRRSVLVSRLNAAAASQDESSDEEAGSGGDAAKPIKRRARVKTELTKRGVLSTQVGRAATVTRESEALATVMRLKEAEESGDNMEIEASLHAASALFGPDPSCCDELAVAQAAGTLMRKL
eukprot:COSAG02_NODE_17312_length_1013_cov_0.933260_1_plen_231_part_10